MTNTTSLVASSSSIAESQENDGDWAWSSFAAAAMEEVSTSADSTPSIDEVLVTTTSDSPEERTQVLMWYGWGLLSAYCFFFILAVFGELIYSLWTQYQTRRSTAVRTRTRRRSPFNLYLVFMMIPDLIMSGFCAFTCIGNAITRGALMSHGMCYFQSWYVVFGFSGSSWMNALIAAEVYRMLQHPFTFSGAAIYQPPTLSRISRDSLAVNLCSLCQFVGTLGCFLVASQDHTQPVRNILLSFDASQRRGSGTLESPFVLLWVLYLDVIGRTLYLCGGPMLQDRQEQSLAAARTTAGLGHFLFPPRCHLSSHVSTLFEAGTDHM